MNFISIRSIKTDNSLDLERIVCFFCLGKAGVERGVGRLRVEVVHELVKVGRKMPGVGHCIAKIVHELGKVGRLRVFVGLVDFLRSIGLEPRK